MKKEGHQRSRSTQILSVAAGGLFRQYGCRFSLYCLNHSIFHRWHELMVCPGRLEQLQPHGIGAEAKHSQCCRHHHSSVHSRWPSCGPRYVERRTWTYSGFWAHDSWYETLPRSTIIPPSFWSLSPLLPPFEAEIHDCLLVTLILPHIHHFIAVESSKWPPEATCSVFHSDFNWQF